MCTSTVCQVKFVNPDLSCSCFRTSSLCWKLYPADIYVELLHLLALMNSGLTHVCMMLGLIVIVREWLYWGGGVGAAACLLSSAI